MYKCEDCGYIFDEPREYSDMENEYGCNGLTWSGCPKCAGNYEEVKKCDYCGKWIPLNEFACDHCQQILQKRLREVLSQFDEEELEYFRENDLF